MKTAIIGAGSWGTALAVHAARAGHDVRLWALEPDVAEEINSRRLNSLFLPGVEIPASVRASVDFKDVLRSAEVVLAVVPTQFVRATIGRALDDIPGEALIVSAGKGIEIGTLLRVTEILEELMGGSAAGRLAVLCGPSFAKEVTLGRPTAVTAASTEIRAARQVQKLLSTEAFRVYTSDDVVGVETCGALKNVIALASGMVAGLGLGDNTRAALITRGLAEIARLVNALGGRRRTVAGLAGVGDMVLTCTSTASRNYSVGLRLGRGESLDDITASTKSVAEGIPTTRSAVALALREGVEMPISRAMYSILFEGLSPREAARQLMTRELRQEWESEEET